VTPISLYQADLKKSNFFADPAQASAIDHLQRLYAQLQEKQACSAKSNLFSRTIQKVLSKQEKKQFLTGLYIYGGVGRGKTYLMDLFFHSLPTQRKLRLHFHHFMRRVHTQLSLLEGQENPLQQIAKTFASETDLLCFDEFFVDDIGDAMIVAGMLSALFDEGVILVATSNIHPNDLYRNGLQRGRFLPAIELIKKNCTIFNLDGVRDYRLGRLIETEFYHTPLNNNARLQIEISFANLATGDKNHAQEILINQRQIKTIATSADTLHIDFIELCGGPRSVLDYIEIAILYRTILISNVRQMGEDENDLARRFIAMVDEFYEHHVVLIISAEREIKQLYIGSKLSFEFERCISRLQEMQSKVYLQQIHHKECTD
jgi:cell division protein ZapE